MLYIAYLESPNSFEQRKLGWVKSSAIISRTVCYFPLNMLTLSAILCFWKALECDTKCFEGDRDRRLIYIKCIYYNSTLLHCVELDYKF